MNTYFSKLLIFIGIIFIIVGILFLFNIPIGKLPGDILIKKDNFTFYFPIITCIIVSILISFIMWLLSKF